MKEIILIVFASGLFIFFLWFFIKLNKKPKKQTKEVENKPTENKKDEIPEILKEVTMGNYMYDISQNDVVDGVELKENELLEKPPEVSLDKRNNIEKAFDEIIDIDSDYDEMFIDDTSEIEDAEDVLLSDIEEDFSDGGLLKENNNVSSNKKSIADQYKGLSKEMKIMLISNILAKKK